MFSRLKLRKTKNGAAKNNAFIRKCELIVKKSEIHNAL